PMDAEVIRDHVLTTLRRSLPGGDRLAFGVGTPVDRLDEVHRSWTEAVYVVDAVQARLNSAGAARADAEAGLASASAEVPEAVTGATAAEVVVRRVAEALRAADAGDGGERVVWPARALARHDANHNGSLLETLRVYFATVGNSAEASRRLHVHSNSLRHRLGRIEEITGL